jgi:putative ABC transport system permease protein
MDVAELARVHVERRGVLDEAVASLTERPGRTLLTGLGTVLGVGVLVAVLGLTATASSQIDSAFTALSATEVTITQSSDPVATRSMAFPADFETRVRRIAGVVDAGLSWQIPAEVAPVDASPVPGAEGPRPSGNVVAASPGALRVAQAHVRMGRLYDDFAQACRARVVVIGPVLADDLGVASLSGHPALTIAGISFSIIGVLSDAARHPELLDDLIVPSSTARSIWGDPSAGSPATGWVSVRKGAGNVVADQLVAAVAPTHPDDFQVTAPPDPRRLRGAVNSSLQSLFLLLAGVCLLVGMVGIANTTFVSVLERLGEIGLRRAYGARRIHIAAQFLCEATVIGFVGGLVGALLGLGVVVGTAITHHWTAVLPSYVVVAGPAVGAATALVAAVYPALRAARIEPITALRVGAS